MTSRSILFLSAKKRPIKEPLVTPNHSLQRIPTCALFKTPNHVVATFSNLEALCHWYPVTPLSEQDGDPISRLFFPVCQGNHHEQRCTYIPRVRPLIDMIHTLENKWDDLLKWYIRYITLRPPTPHPHRRKGKYGMAHQTSMTQVQPRITCDLCDLIGHWVNQCKDWSTLQTIFAQSPLSRKYFSLTKRR